MTVSPTATTYTVGSSTFISVNWSITTTGNGGGTATSPNGVYSLDTSVTPVGATQIPATAFATGGISISVPSLTSGTFAVPESFTIPAAVLSYAQTNNLTTIYYSRDFLAGAEGYTTPEFVQINLAFPVANPDAVLNISRVALRFSDNTSIKIIQPDTHIMAVADISYTGSGLFDAMWEIAEPVSTMGQPVFVPMQPVRQFLVAGGRVYLQSPTLPTQKQGLHILRLRVMQPALTFTAPILQYSVNSQGDTSTLPTLPPVRINKPAENALLATDTRFEWQAVKGAHAYQLELFLPEQTGLKPDDAAIAKRAPDSGMMVPAKRNALTLGELSRSKLRPNTTYYWRIIAIGNKGQILSTSALREIRIP
ncbi:MAG: hypothetical protein HYZ31_00465 [Gammaproteobacteria bacterium]|nr:hypothetical protein [Gammaproteobacteria bacterium]